MSDLFNIYEDNLNSTFTKISNIINTLQNLSRDKTEYALNEANSLFEDALTLIKKLELEVSSYSSQDKGAMKIKNCKNEYESLKKKFTILQEKYIKNKSDEALYLNSEKGDEMNTKNLVDHEEIAYSQHSKLDKAKTASLDVENKCNEAMRQLHQQTKMMNKINSNLEEENDILQNSNSLLGSMLKRENRNKLIILISVMVIIFICLIVFLIS